MMMLDERSVLGLDWRIMGRVGVGPRDSVQHTQNERHGCALILP